MIDLSVIEQKPSKKIKMQVNYDTYFGLCDAMDELWEGSSSKTPGNTALGLMREISIKFILPVACLVTNNDYSSDNAKAVDRIIKNNVVFVEKEVVPELPVSIPYSQYEKMTKLLKKSKWMGEVNTPSMEQIETCIKPYLPYMAFILIFFIERGKDNPDTEEYKMILSLYKENFKIEKDSRIEVRKEEFDSLRSSIKNCTFQRGRWFPTKKDIEEVLAPNIDKTYDFILWILETGEEPQTNEEKEAEAMLRALIHDHVRVIV